MYKSFALIFSFLVLTACGKSGGGSSGAGTAGNQASSVGLEEISAESPVPSAAHTFDINFDLSGFNGTQTDKIEEAARLIKEVVASEEFKTRVLNHKYKGKKRFVDNGGLTNAQIYQKLLEGSEKLNPGKNNSMDLKLKVYTESNSVLGYTMPSTLNIWMNTKYLNKNPSNMVAQNMMHEWLHKLGFKHDSKRTPSRPYSVPYGIGYIIADMAAKLS